MKSSFPTVQPVPSKTIVPFILCRPYVSSPIFLNLPRHCSSFTALLLSSLLATDTDASTLISADATHHASLFGRKDSHFKYTEIRLIDLSEHEP
ncbi:hypothetical protein E2C01_055731 [Portunus trituberculatus]|uniref:Uncharacterized protein n=1 Tax=Portunus trituberculatus TaxID=210409 RepID=A0A5B7GVJ5_PORTR|nr:hypothetical protein [Portunus trituberculatus]